LDNRGKILLTKAENVLVQRMHEALEVTAGDWLRGAGHTELSFFWRDAATGLLLKARPDRVVDTVSGDPLVVDVKTSSDASQEGFERSYERFFYGVQESQYTEAIRVRYGREPIYRFVVVQNREPIICNIFRTQADVAVRERDRWRSAVNELAQRLSSGNWEDGYVEREPDEAGW
jgi:exodeoxyribonuclease VIII